MWIPWIQSNIRTLVWVALQSPLLCRDSRLLIVQFDSALWTYSHIYSYFVGPNRNSIIVTHSLAAVQLICLMRLWLSNICQFICCVCSCWYWCWGKRQKIWMVLDSTLFLSLINCFFFNDFINRTLHSASFDEEELSSRVRCAFCNVWFHNLLLMLPWIQYYMIARRKSQTSK